MIASAHLAHVQLSFLKSVVLPRLDDKVSELLLYQAEKGRGLFVLEPERDFADIEVWKDLSSSSESRSKCLDMLYASMKSHGLTVSFVNEIVTVDALCTSSAYISWPTDSP